MKIEEKLKRIKELADKMYSRMAYLTSDTRPIREAMDEYHQFIIHEYHKEEPTIAEIVDEHWWEMLGEEPVSEDLEESAENYAATDEVLPNGKVMINFQAEKAFKAGAQWQKEQMMKDSIKMEAHPSYGELWGSLDSIGCKNGDKVKVIIIKEDWL